MIVSFVKLHAIIFLVIVAFRFAVTESSLVMPFAPSELVSI